MEERSAEQRVTERELSVDRVVKEIDLSGERKSSRSRSVALIVHRITRITVENYSLVVLPSALWSVCSWVVLMKVN